jgi:transcription elongation factor GreA
MPVRETLPSILRGEQAADLAPADREALEALAGEARGEGLLAYVRDEAAARLRQANPSHGVEYLLAAACALNGEIERAEQTLLALGEKLAQAKRWESLAAVAERALELEETQAGARLLVRAHEGLAAEPARLQALERARAIMPDDLELGLLLAVRLGDAGQHDRRRALLVDLLPRFAAGKRYAGLEEAALEFAERGVVDGLVRLIDQLPVVVAQGAVDEARQLLAIAFPPLAAAARAGEVHAALRDTAARAAAAAGGAAAEPYRGALIESLRQGPARELPDAAGVIAAAGLEDTTVPVLTALERYDVIAALPPGRAVLHGSFGAGRIAANDGTTVRIDFAKSAGHPMPYAAARRTLTPLAEDDLRLLRLTNPAELARLRKDEPAEILVRALKASGGEADAAKLKLFLVGHQLVPAPEWTTFFRRARAAAVQDPRIDHARAFEQHYALAAEPAPGAAAADAAAADRTPLPAIEPRKPVKTNLLTIRKFLAQHPQAEPALAQRFGRYAERALLDEEGALADRARAGLYFARWFPDRAAEWVTALKDLWERGLSISDLSGEEEQVALLEASHAAGVESDAILSALDSRFAAVREAAGRYRAHLDEAGRAGLRRTLLEHAPRYPAAAMRLIDEELSAAQKPVDGWRLLWAACALIEERPKPSLADKVVSWLEPGGPFDRLLAGNPAPEDQALRIGVLLRQWRSSDRYLFPALEVAERLGLGEAVAAVRNRRQQKAERMFAQVGQQADVDIPVMTRATWERLKKELERLERELRTTIPATIQKARELGDLRENAEYHSAKLKQANVSKQVASLQLRLARARFVEEADLKDGVVGLGTEVVLESADELTTYWILGEGEHHLGENVISFQTPVARALMGHAIGDEVEIDRDGGARRYRVVSVERKLPPHAGEAEPAHAS